jgi:hypothetical protein
MSFGSRSTNKRFRPPEKFLLNGVETESKLNNKQYYPLIDDDGTITVKRPTVQGDAAASVGLSGESVDVTVGTYAKDGSFNPNSLATPEERLYFSSVVGQSSTKNQAVQIVEKAGVPQQQARQLIFPNTATPGGTPGPAAGTGPDSEPASVPLSTENETIEKLGGTIKSGKSEGTVRSRLAAIDVRYPEKLDEKTQDSILFRLKEITGRDFSGTNRKDTNFSFGTKALSDEFGRVVLPIQPSISDSNGVDWGGSTLDPLSAFAGRASLAIAESEGQVTQAITEQFKLAANQFKRNYEDYKQAINLYLAQEAVGAQGLFSRATGAILNPNLELLFNGPTLRSFNFTFRLSPRSEGEAKIVKDIIYFFKAGMAVRTAESGVFLKAPYVFSIKYCSGPSSQHKSLNRIKDCALLGCDIDYTPDGSYMTFNDKEKTMTSYQLTLRFGELDPLYNDLYADGHPIGY